MAKCTKKEKLRRTYEIKALLLEGAASNEIHDFSMAEWGISPSQTQRYIADAYDLINEEAAKYSQATTAWHFESRRSLFAKCMDVNDYANARQILSDLAKLQDLYPDYRKAQNVTHEQTGPPVIHIEMHETPIDDDLKKKIESKLQTNDSDN